MQLNAFLQDKPHLQRGKYRRNTFPVHRATYMQSRFAFELVLHCLRYCLRLTIHRMPIFSPRCAPIYATRKLADVPPYNWIAAAFRSRYHRTKMNRRTLIFGGVQLDNYAKISQGCCRYRINARNTESLSATGKTITYSECDSEGIIMWLMYLQFDRKMVQICGKIIFIVTLSYFNNFLLFWITILFAFIILFFKNCLVVITVKMKNNFGDPFLHKDASIFITKLYHNLINFANLINFNVIS